jgi:ABC-type branched-subunit amino acid transport system substrate-binding protein
MILATTTVEDVDRFLKVFGTKGADKRALHGSKGSIVFRDPTEENRMWVLFEWDEQGWANFVSDPEVPDPEGSRTPRQARYGGAARPVPGVGRRATMTSAISRPARVGLITDQTGALSFMGVANVNLAKMVTDDINAHGGLLGRPVEL